MNHTQRERVHLHLEEMPPKHLELDSVPRVGEGIIWSEGDRFIVTSVWHSFDHHGRLEEGVHVFATRVTETEHDLPWLNHPDYYGTHHSE